MWTCYKKYLVSLSFFIFTNRIWTIFKIGLESIAQDNRILKKSVGQYSILNICPRDFSPCKSETIYKNIHIFESWRLWCTYFSTTVLISDMDAHAKNRPQYRNIS